MTRRLHAIDDPDRLTVSRALLKGLGVEDMAAGGAGEYLAAALVIVAMSRALMRFADVDEALRAAYWG